jgi:hypothetical protein
VVVLANVDAATRELLGQPLISNPEEEVNDICTTLAVAGRQDKNLCGEKRRLLHVQDTLKFSKVSVSYVYYLK